MVRRSVLTEQEVFEAATRLKVMGKQVTALKILTLLGGGSLTTIYRYLEIWEANNPPTPLNAGGDLPPDIVLDAFKGVWKLALDEAAKHAVASSADHMLNHSLTEAPSDAGAQRIMVAQLMNQIESQKDELKRLHKNLASERKERDKAIEHGARLEGEVKALQLANAELLSRVSRKGGKR